VRPGCRAPHAWLGRGSETLSTLDLFGPGFTLLTGSGDRAWRDACRSTAADLAVPLACYAIGDAGLEDRDRVLFTRFGIESTGAVLVRPDGFVGWRTRRGGEHGILRDVVRRILDRPGA